MKPISPLTIQCHVRHQSGLHARPAGLLAKRLKQFEADIKLRNISKNSAPCSAKNIVNILNLECEYNDLLECQISGNQAEEAYLSFIEFMNNAIEN